jgi:release factor glutamine methyltransferase
MTLEETLRQAVCILSNNKIEDAHLEARVLMGHVLKLSSAALYTEPEQYLSKELENNFQKLIERRLQREPAAYILKRKEFYGIDFYVDGRVLIPRPETELLVEEIMKFNHSEITNPAYTKNHLSIADIGTGCGNIAISLALNISRAKLIAVDISSAALEVARLNCEYHKATSRITLLQGNLLEPVIKPIDLIVANLPYIKNSDLANLNPEVYCFEPRLALDGGEDGLYLINQLLKQIKEKIHQQCHILLEIGAGQEKQIVTMINTHLPDAEFEFISDLNSITRVVKIKYLKLEL